MASFRSIGIRVAKLVAAALLFILALVVAIAVGKYLSGG